VEQAWQLVTELLAAKYSCLLAIPLMAALKRPGQVLVCGGSLSRSIKAMAAHHSQWVW